MSCFSRKSFFQEEKCERESERERAQERDIRCCNFKINVVFLSSGLD